MRIGVLTGGGDAPGLNAAIRAITRKAVAEGIEVIGFRNGWLGALTGSWMTLDAQAVSGITVSWRHYSRLLPHQPLFEGGGSRNCEEAAGGAWGGRFGAHRR